MNAYFRPQGIITALATPLRRDQTVDEDALRRLVEYVLANGVHGVFAVSTQGEFYALSTAEKEQVTAVVVDQVRGRVPVYVGTGATTTAEGIALGTRAAALGADALSVITPYFVKPSQRELLAHYRAIASAVDLPVVLYNNPPRTGVSLNTATVVELAKLDNVVGIKDSSADLVQTMEYIDGCPKDFCVLAGNDALICATLLMGGAGAIAASANVAPRLVVDLYEAMCRGDVATAVELQYRLLPLRRAFNLGTFPVVIKEAMELIGLSAGPAKSPVGGLDEEARDQLRHVLDKLGLLGSAA
ncbi:MAG: 4-hydroxy-tetrahydrodipicolinate synthase [Chloroflexota bacterium]